MAAPEYIPRSPTDRPRVYESPPWNGEPWLADRPGELGPRQPQGPRLGYQGPDQGFGLTLAERFRDKVVVVDGESVDDTLVGASAIAMKRASLFGRAPVVHDLTSALTVWGFLSEADAELVRLRMPYFEGVANPHHYMERRKLADVVPQATLRLSHTDVAKAAATDWRSLFKRKSS